MDSQSQTIVQGSPAWREFKLGKVSASRFKVVLTEAKTKAARERGELSVAANKYMLELGAEILTKQDQGIPATWAMQWGIDNEPAARDLYSELMGVEVKQVGFVSHPDEPMIGGSPDGLVGDNGGLEIKCPANTGVHLAYILGGELPKEHVAQVQGHLWISGRSWWDFVSYDPRIKDLRLALWQLRIHRDEPYIANLENAVFAFRDKLLETLCELKISGGL